MEDKSSTSPNCGKQEASVVVTPKPKYSKGPKLMTMLPKPRRRRTNKKKHPCTMGCDKSFTSVEKWKKHLHWHQDQEDNNKTSSSSGSEISATPVTPVKTNKGKSLAHLHLHAPKEKDVVVTTSSEYSETSEGDNDDDEEEEEEEDDEESLEECFNNKMKLTCTVTTKTSDGSIWKPGMPKYFRFAE